MTVAELIEELRKYPPDVLVAVWIGSKSIGHYSNATGINLMFSEDKEYVELSHDDACI